MHYNDRNYRVQGFWSRILSVWYRHFRVYQSDFISNAFPPFFEPLIFLLGLGVGLGSFLPEFAEKNYLLFLASGLIVSSAMYTASFECTYGTFIRLEFDKVYDGMLGAPLSPRDLLLGELLFAGTKGFFFSGAVLIVTFLFDIIRTPWSLLVPFVGFLAGLMFGVFGLWITAYVKNINHFNFFFTGLLSPMFFFSGVIFPLENLPAYLQVIGEIIPLTHVVRLARALCIPGSFEASLFLDLSYMVLFTLVVGYLGIHKLTKRLID